MSTSTSGRCLFQLQWTTLKNRERKSWRGDPGTSDYRAGCEKALLTARNLQSERDRVVNELRKLSNETGKGKQYSGQKYRCRDRGPDTEQTKRKIALVFHVSIPSGVPRIVNARRRLRQLMVGPGWGPAHALPVDGIYHGPICLPIPINTVYVGFGNQEIFLRPSPWCNPSVFFTEYEQEANWIFAQFGRLRAAKFNGCLQFLGSSWHVTAVSQSATLLCFMN